MGKKKPELITPPIWHKEQDGVYGTSKLEAVKEKIMDCFLTRILNAIEEKTTYCVEVEKMTMDETRHVLTQVVKNIPNHLLPLPFNNKGKEENTDLTFL